jgi:hypothetical protein
MPMTVVAALAWRRRESLAHKHNNGTFKESAEDEWSGVWGNGRGEKNVLERKKCAVG